MEYNIGKRVNRSKAIRLKCLDCCCGNRAEVRRCHIMDCPLWRYRMGKEIKEDGTFCEPENDEIDDDSDD